MKNYFVLMVLLLFMNSCLREPDRPEQSADTYVELYCQDKSEITAYNLIEPIEANNLLIDAPKDYIPVQISKAGVFSKGHLLNAQNIWRPDYGSDNTKPFSGLIPTKEKLQRLLQTLGFKKGKTLLLYDAKANVDALRFAWVLNLYGFDHFKIINGGLVYWKKLGLPISSKSTKPQRKTVYQLENNFDHSIIVSFKEVLSATKDTNTLLIDNREDYEYKGMPFIFKEEVLPFKKGAFERGSIPSAIHLNWSQLADLNGDHRIKSEKDLRHDLKQQGIDPNKNIILYCHSGSRTSHTFYVLKHVLGYEKVKNYDGSWIEWSYNHSKDSTIPIAQHCSETQFLEYKDSLVSSLKMVE